jgi:DNA-binding response OmpR family regulator
MRRVLIVEDNADLAFGLRTTLEIEGYGVEVAEDGPRGLARAREWRPDLVILDLMLPGMDGYHVLRELRGGGSAVPVLILTARGEEYDKLLGFRGGADDYVTKPFSLLELLARVEALLRRAGSVGGEKAGADRTVRFGDVAVDPDARTVTRGGEFVSLTPKEFDLLLALYGRGGGVVSRHDLLREVWGYLAAVPTRTVDIHVAELRRKLEADPATPRHILTVWKKGYRLQR